MKEDKSLFHTLNAIDVNEFKRKKGRYDYLSWAHAVTELLKVCPDAVWHIHEYEIDGKVLPYMPTPTGFYVKTSVTAGKITRSHTHPVLDNYNNVIKEPDAFQINTSIQRCLAKTIALHGLGLYIFAGEDLPDIEDKPKTTTSSSSKSRNGEYIVEINQLLKNKDIQLPKKDREATEKWLKSEQTEAAYKKAVEKLKLRILKDDTISLDEMVKGV